MTIIQKELEANSPATVQKNINLKALNDTLTNVPSYKEQIVILYLLKKISERNKKIKDSAQSVLDQIDTIKNPSWLVLFVASWEQMIQRTNRQWSC